jgi:hypothetical protein
LGTEGQGDGEGSKAEGTTHQVLEYRATFEHSTQFYTQPACWGRGCFRVARKPTRILLA